jgi:hypothetical protein
MTNNLIVKESKSIVTIICEEGSLPKLEGTAHGLALKYLGLSASLRDRENLSRLICKSTPDLLTQTIREGIYAYDPIIRKCHQSVDLSASCQNLEDFFKDFFGLFGEHPIPEGETTHDDKIPGATKSHKATVEDIANVLRKHQSGIHRFCHQFVNNGGDIATLYRNYAKTAASHFKIPDEDINTQPGAIVPSKILNAHLSAIVAELSTEDRKKATSTLDDYAAYLSALSAVSTDRLNGLMEGENPPVGPGAFLARWNNLMEAEPSTPLIPEGSGPRYGVARVIGKGETVDVKSESVEDSRWKWPDVPEGLGEVVTLLGGKFQRVLGELGLQFWMVHPMEEQGS